MATALLSAPPPLTSSAASLRIEFAEVAAAVTRLMAGRVLRVSAIGPAGAAQSHDIRLQVSPWPTTAHGEMDLPAPQLSVAGGTYRIAPVAVFDVSISATVIDAGLRLVLAGTGEQLTLSVVCEAGVCFPAAVLPRLVWRQPTLTLDARVASDGLTIAISVVAIGGLIGLECPPGWLVERTGCELLSNMILPEIARRKAGRGPSMAATPDWTAPIAATPVAAVLPLPTIEVVGMTSDTTGVRVSFCLSPECPERLGRHPR